MSLIFCFLVIRRSTFCCNRKIHLSNHFIEIFNFLPFWYDLISCVKYSMEMLTFILNSNNQSCKHTVFDFISNLTNNNFFYKLIWDILREKALLSCCFYVGNNLILFNPLVFSVYDKVDSSCSFCMLYWGFWFRIPRK